MTTAEIDAKRSPESQGIIDQYWPDSLLTLTGKSHKKTKESFAEQMDAMQIALIDRLMTTAEIDAKRSPESQGIIDQYWPDSLLTLTGKSHKKTKESFAEQMDAMQIALIDRLMLQMDKERVE